MATGVSRLLNRNFKVMASLVLSRRRKMLPTIAAIRLYLVANCIADSGTLAAINSKSNKNESYSRKK